MALAPAVRLDVARADGRLLAEPLPEVRLEAFGPSILDLALLVWVDSSLLAPGHPGASAAIYAQLILPRGLTRRRPVAVVRA